LVCQLTFRYNRYQERKAEASAKYRAKKAREEVEEWDGITNEETIKNNASGSDSDSESEEGLDPVDSLLTSLGPRLDARSKGQMSKRAALFFDQPEFKGLSLDTIENSVPKEPSQSQPDLNGERNRTENIGDDEDIEMEDSASENGFEEVPTNNTEPDTWDADSDSEKVPSAPSTLHL
jgi:AdoMet-dependent rRNA methyltransferase SPB1